MSRLLMFLRVLIIAGALDSLLGQPVVHLTQETLVSWNPGLPIWDERQVVRLVFTAISVGLL